MSAPATALVLAEKLRWRSSPPQKLIAVVVAFAVVSTALYAGSGLDRTWDATLAWTNLWAVGLGPVFAALLPWAMTRMEQRTRSGGTRWIAVDRVVERVARLTVLVSHLLLANLVAVGVPIAAGGLIGVSGPVPWSSALALVAVCTCGQAVVSAVALRVADATTPLAGLGTGIAWALSWLVVGTVESPSWFWFPGNWTIRGALPLLGTHANGVALDPGSPLTLASPWVPAVLSLILAALIVSLRLPSPVRRVSGDALVLPRETDTRPNSSTPPAPAGVGESTGGFAVDTGATGLAPRWRARPGTAVLSTIGPWRLVVPVVVTAATAALVSRWRPVGDADMFLRLGLVPIVATVVPVAVWHLVRPAWRVVASRPSRSVRPMATVTGISWGVVVLGAAFAGTGLVLKLGLAPASAARTVVATAACAGVVVPLVTYASVAWGAAGAVGLGLVGMLFGLLLGVGPLHDTLWWAAPWGYAALSEPWQVAIAAVAAIVIAPTATTAAGRRAARTSVSDSD